MAFYFPADLQLLPLGLEISHLPLERGRVRQSPLVRGAARFGRLTSFYKLRQPWVIRIPVDVFPNNYQVKHTLSRNGTIEDSSHALRQGWYVLACLLASQHEFNNPTGKVVARSPLSPSTESVLDEGSYH